jgi:hypothetical protein
VNQFKLHGRLDAFNALATLKGGRDVPRKGNVELMRRALELFAVTAVRIEFFDS